MKTTILFIVSMMLAPAQDQSSVQAQVADLEVRRFHAMADADVPTLERLLSDDLIYTHASGWRQTKTEFLASIRSGELLYRSFTAESFKAKVYGNTILVTGRASGVPVSAGRVICCWVSRLPGDERRRPCAFRFRLSWSSP